MSSINEKIMKIMSLALEISPADMKQTGENPQVFVEYLPHCKLLDVSVYLKGWKKGGKVDYTDSFCGNWNNADKKADEIIAFLENLKKEVYENGEC